MRKSYHSWSESDILILKEYVEQGLKWVAISAKLSAAYDKLISPESCRSAYRRHRDDSPSLRIESESDLPRLFVDPLPQAVSDLAEEKRKSGFSRLFYVPFRCSDEQRQQALQEAWIDYVDYIVELNEDVVTLKEIERAKRARPERWFERWMIPFSLGGHPEWKNSIFTLCQYIVSDILRGGRWLLVNSGASQIEDS